MSKTIVIEEYANVDETFQNIKNIKVGSMTLNDLFGDNLKVIEKALEERKELLKWKDSQQDLIKGKDEYIAKLCNDRAEKSSALRIQENNNIHLVESNLRLMEENKELREFARIVSKDIVISKNTTMSNDITYGCNFYNEILHKDNFNLIKRVVEKYGK